MSTAETPAPAVSFTVDGESAPSEGAALERARKRVALRGGDVEVWMQSGAWALLLARWQNGEQVFPHNRSKAA